MKNIFILAQRRKDAEKTLKMSTLRLCARTEKNILIITYDHQAYFIFVKKSVAALMYWLLDTRNTLSPSSSV